MAEGVAVGIEVAVIAVEVEVTVAVVEVASINAVGGELVVGAIIRTTLREATRKASRIDQAVIGTTRDNTHCHPNLVRLTELLLHRSNSLPCNGQDRSSTAIRSMVLRLQSRPRCCRRNSTMHTGSSQHNHNNLQDRCQLARMSTRHSSNSMHSINSSSKHTPLGLLSIRNNISMLKLKHTALHLQLLLERNSSRHANSNRNRNRRQNRSTIST